MLLNRRRPLLALSGAFALATLVGAPSPAWATCVYECTADLFFEDCTQPLPGTWPLGTPLTFTCSCQECCSAPGGPSTCNPAPVDLSLLKLTNANFNPVPGAFAAENAKCMNTDLFSFDGALALGSYGLVAEFLTILQFDVVDAGTSSSSSSSGGGSGTASGTGGAGGGAGGASNTGGSGGASNTGGASPAPGDLSPPGDACDCSLPGGAGGERTLLPAIAALALIGASTRRRKRG